MKKSTFGVDSGSYYGMNTHPRAPTLTMNITVYTDGSWHPKQSAGGWGVVVRYETDTGLPVEMRDYGGKKNATSSGEMEVTAVLEALRMLPNTCNVTLYSDNQYAMKSLVKDGDGNVLLILDRVRYTGWIRGWMRTGPVGKWRSSQGAVKNQHLWADILVEIDRLLRHGSSIYLKWIPRGSMAGNVVADELASLGAANYFAHTR